MTLEFDSDEEFSDFQTEMDLIKHEAEEAGRCCGPRNRGKRI